MCSSAEVAGPDADFLARYHATAAGITEDLLAIARDYRGRNPYQWLAEAIPPKGRVLDVGCGSAPMADLVGVDRYLGVDRSVAELAAGRGRRPAAVTVLGDALQPPVAGSFAAVVASMALMLIDLDAFLAQVGPLLVAGGGLAAIVPTRDVPVGQPYRTLLDLLGITGRPFPEPLPAATLASRLATAGFALAADDTQWFDRPAASAADIDLIVASFYADQPDRAAAARQFLRIRRAQGATQLPYPLRRVVARRTDD